MRISFISTVYNEEKTIDFLLESVFAQTVKPNEIIIADGGSSDNTVAKMKNEKVKMKNYNLKFKIIAKLGNRAVGRNEAIKQASGDIILSTDAGCVLDKNWVRNITTPFQDGKVDVVAGYYKGIPKTIFQKCLVPYVLVMPDKVDPHTFLPASRSMAFKKTVWQKVGGFPENFSHNEDYVFAQSLKKTKTKIVFAKNAIVYWQPRKNLREAFYMFYRFAYGDAEAGIFRPKVRFIFLRYLVGIALLVLFFTFEFTRKQALLIFYFLLFLYILWAIAKNYRYVKDPRAFVLLPVLQFACDFAVILGSLCGIMRNGGRSPSSLA